MTWLVAFTCTRTPAIARWRQVTVQDARTHGTLDPMMSFNKMRQDWAHSVQKGDRMSRSAWGGIIASFIIIGMAVAISGLLSRIVILEETVRVLTEACK